MLIRDMAIIWILFKSQLYCYNFTGLLESWLFDRATALFQWSDWSKYSRGSIFSSRGYVASNDVEGQPYISTSCCIGLTAVNWNRWAKQIPEISPWSLGNYIEWMQCSACKWEESEFKPWEQGQSFKAHVTPDSSPQLNDPRKNAELLSRHWNNLGSLRWTGTDNSNFKGCNEEVALTELLIQRNLQQKLGSLTQHSTASVDIKAKQGFLLAAHWWNKHNNEQQVTILIQAQFFEHRENKLNEQSHVRLRTRSRPWGREEWLPEVTGGSGHSGGLLNF